LASFRRKLIQAECGRYELSIAVGSWFACA
jgi:hypothetical protein